MFSLFVEDEEGEREKEQQVLVSVVVLHRLDLAIVATSARRLDQMNINGN